VQQSARLPTESIVSDVSKLVKDYDKNFHLIDLNFSVLKEWEKFKDHHYIINNIGNGQIIKTMLCHMSGKAVRLIEFRMPHNIHLINRITTKYVKTKLCLVLEKLGMHIYYNETGAESHTFKISGNHQYKVLIFIINENLDVLNTVSEEYINNQLDFWCDSSPIDTKDEQYTCTEFFEKSPKVPKNKCKHLGESQITKGTVGKLSVKLLRSSIKTLLAKRNEIELAINTCEEELQRRIHLRQENTCHLCSLISVPNYSIIHYDDKYIFHLRIF
jgi:hypothetical protein